MGSVRREIGSGERFGRLVFVRMDKRVNGYLACLTKCDCGVKKTILKCNLMNGTTISCGCARSGRKIKKSEITTRLEEVISKLYAENFSTRQISKLIGYSSTYIGEIVKRLGISRDRVEAVVLAMPAKSTHWRTTRSVARRKVERKLGRKLERLEHVHHIDKNYCNNAIENLVVMNASDHIKLHHPKNPNPRWTLDYRRTYMKEYLRKYHQRKKAEKNAKTV